MENNLFKEIYEILESTVNDPRSEFEHKVSQDGKERVEVYNREQHLQFVCEVVMEMIENNIVFEGENVKMNNLTKKDYKEIDQKLRYDKIFEDEKQNKKMLELLEKSRDRETSVIKREYPQLSDSNILEILNDYREYRELINAIEVFRDFPTNYAEPNLNRFLTEDAIEDLKGAVEEMAYYVENLEDNA